MELNTIKKELYKQKPTATLVQIQNGQASYGATLLFDNIDVGIRFEVPVDDMGTAIFYNEMDAKLLIRWIVIQ